LFVTNHHLMAYCTETVTISFFLSETHHVMTGLLDILCGAGSLSNLVCVQETWNSVHRMKN